MLFGNASAVLIVWILYAYCGCCATNEYLESVYGNISNSRELFQPTPLISNLSASDAEILIQEANSMFVSNISLMDFLQNNETHHMLLRYRERNRQNRIIEIQQEILQKLGLSRSHNVTSRMSAEERNSLLMSFDRTMMAKVDNDTVDCDDEHNLC